MRQGLLVIVHQDGAAESLEIDGLGVFHHHHFPLPQAQAVVERAVELVQVLVDAGEHIEHTFAGQPAFLVIGRNVLTVNLADEGQRIIVAPVLVGDGHRGILHIGGQIRVAPPFGRAEKLRLCFLQ